MLNHGASINRVSSKLSLRTVITIYEKRSRAHGSAVTRVARQRTPAPPPAHTVIERSRITG